MIKTRILFFLGVTLLISCERESDSGYLEITVAGKTYREERSLDDLAGDGAKELCDLKTGFASLIGEMETSTFIFGVSLYHRQSYDEFKISTPGQYDVGNTNLEGFTSFCNLDLEAGFTDKDLPTDPAVLQTHGKSHSVESIKAYNETDTEVRYLIKGEFSCTFMTSVNKIYSVTGNYQTAIRLIK